MHAATYTFRRAIYIVPCWQAELRLMQSKQMRKRMSATRRMTMMKKRRWKRSGRKMTREEMIGRRSVKMLFFGIPRREMKVMMMETNAMMMLVQRIPITRPSRAWMSMMQHGTLTSTSTGITRTPSTGHPQASHGAPKLKLNQWAIKSRAITTAGAGSSTTASLLS